jgi:crotonobetainyl-CoA:carnitine CoA-transferase CaiB-like acyl-CoA transferase
MVALFDARRTGLGRDVDTNLYDSALAMLSYPATWYLSSGFVTRRHEMSAHPSVVPFQFFATADGHIAVACAKEKFFRSLIERMDLPDVAADERFADFDSRGRHRPELVGRLSERFAERSTAAWLQALKGHVPIAPVRSMEEALELDGLRGRRMLAEYEHEAFGTVRSIGSPLRLGDFETRYARAPELGADTDAVMRENGYSTDEVDRLHAQGAFGTAPVSDARVPRSGEGSALD